VQALAADGLPPQGRGAPALSALVPGSGSSKTAAPYLQAPAILTQRPQPAGGMRSQPQQQRQQQATSSLDYFVKAGLALPSPLASNNVDNASAGNSTASVKAKAKAQATAVPKLAVAAISPPDSLLVSQTARAAPGQSRAAAAAAASAALPNTARAALGEEEAFAAGERPSTRKGARTQQSSTEAGLGMEDTSKPMPAAAAAEAPATVTVPVAPGAPSSSSHGGRRGRNIVPVGADAGVTSSPANVAGPTGGFLGTRSDAQRNKTTNQGTSNIIAPVQRD
jgi:hypothetical protein